MTTARQIRQRGWNALKKGGWWPMLGGCAAWNVAWTLFGACAVFAMIRLVGGDCEPIARDGTLDPRNVWKLFCMLNVMLAPFVLAFYYFAAVQRFSACAMGMATMRGGVTFAHAFSGFGKGWKTVWLMGCIHFIVGVMALFLIVPGVVAALSYSQAYFVKVDHPDWSAIRCMDESRRLMRGSKMRYLRFCLSFLGWFILAGITSSFLCGIPYLVLLPYFFVAQAAFYEDLLDKDEGLVLDGDQAAVLRRALAAAPSSGPTDFTDPSNPR